MGKTKQPSAQKHVHLSPPHPPPPRFSGIKPCSSKVRILSEEKPLKSVESSELKHLSSVFGIMDCSKRLIKAHEAIEHQERSIDSTLLKRSRNHFGRHYYRRSSKNYTSTSTSCGKDISPRQDVKISFKLPTTHSNSESSYHSESWEKTHKPESISSSSLVVDQMSVNVMKMVCKICENPLRRKPNFLSRLLSSPPEHPVVAVLVCGHAYHADCLEQRTSIEDRHDPACPSCSGIIGTANSNCLRSKEKAVHII